DEQRRANRRLQLAGRRILGRDAVERRTAPTASDAGGADQSPERFGRGAPDEREAEPRGSALVESTAGVGLARPRAAGAVGRGERTPCVLEPSRRARAGGPALIHRRATDRRRNEPPHPGPRRLSLVPRTLRLRQPCDPPHSPEGRRVTQRIAVDEEEVR